MVVVTIILITAALAAPGIIRGMAINRAQRGVGDLGRVFRRARVESTAYGRAYVMVYRLGAGRGRWELWRGLNDSCRLNPWARIVTAGGCDAGAGDCVDVWDGVAYSGSGTAHRVEIAAPPSAQVCFEPNGDVYTANAFNFTLANQTVRVQVSRFDEDISTSAPVERRFVVVPMLAAPMVEQVGGAGS